MKIQQRNFKVLAASLLAVCATSVCQAQAPQPDEVQTITTKSPQLQLTQFYSGVYLYEYQFARNAKERDKDYFAFLDLHLAILEQHGVNAIYLGGTSQGRFAQTLQLMAKHGMKLIPQLDFAYFQSKWTDVQIDQYAKLAGQFIATYQDDPRVLSWSVKEEVNPADNDRLALYHSKILEYAPRAQLNIIDYNLTAAKERKPPYPAITGTDRYGFWWEFSGGGYLASPASALSWTRTQAALYYAEAAQRNSDYMLAVTTQGMMMPALANRAMQPNEAAPFPPGTAEDREKFRERVARFAEDGRMGWKKFTAPNGETRYNVWKYYRPPVNCTKALAWTSVLEGAKLFFIWSYSPPDKRDSSLDVKTAALEEKPVGEVQYWTLAGRPGKPNLQLGEFADANREIRPYGRIIAQMTKLPASPIQCSQSGVYHNGFSVPGIQGQIVVLHNANVGIWPPDSGRQFKSSDLSDLGDDRNLRGSWQQFKDDDQVFIDDDGNLVGYVPFKNALKVQFSLQDGMPAGNEVFDVLSGKKIAHRKTGFETSIKPGSGTLVFVGSSQEAQKLHQLVTSAGQ